MAEDILARIVAVKHEEVEAARRRVIACRVGTEARTPATGACGFARAARQGGRAPGRDREIKKASPSKGLLREPLDRRRSPRAMRHTALRACRC